MFRGGILERRRLEAIRNTLLSALRYTPTATMVKSHWSSFSRIIAPYWTESVCATKGRSSAAFMIILLSPPSCITTHNICSGSPRLKTVFDITRKKASSFWVLFFGTELPHRFYRLKQHGIQTANFVDDPSRQNCSD